MAKAIAQGAKPAKAGKPERQKKLKLLSEKFKLLKAEFAALDALKTRAAKADLPAKRSALLRAGIQALTAMNDSAFAAALGSLPATKPAAGKGKKD
jgi:hypothetical protein